jgi:predicted oxidoreductase
LNEQHENVRLGRKDLIYGCMRIAGDGSAAATNAGKDTIRAAIDAGYRRFDHADIYGGGRCEELFGAVLKESPALRDSLKITSKCGVRFAGDPDSTSPKRYDLSKAYISESVHGSLRRLGVEQLDTLLLHRPDYLFDAEEAAEAFEQLHRSGEVSSFGVSNFTRAQVDLLESVCPYPITVNQIEISLYDISAFENGLLDQCQQLGISPEAWGPLRGVRYSSIDEYFAPEVETRVRAELGRQAVKYETEDWIIVLAWLLKHPASIVPVLGTVDTARIRAAREVLELDYERDDWYQLLETRRGVEVA